MRRKYVRSSKAYVTVITGVQNMIEVKIGEATKLAIGSTILLIPYLQGASMNPARMPHPSIVSNQYRGLLVYMLGSAVGAIVGARAHNIIRFTDKPLADIVKNSSILQKKGCPEIICCIRNAFRLYVFWGLTRGWSAFWYTLLVRTISGRQFEWRFRNKKDIGCVSTIQRPVDLHTINKSFVRCQFVAMQILMDIELVKEVGIQGMT
ncbi:major intrinsic protein, Aquaporin-like protein [Artemisia annua]|uniref:Major intrinsic protein, Aquaporin-like protein n=1 Tax=Artemisia annua TaxID=35608 RepID=A0A2U1KMQ6_ARTAN|nr:major intrinsic protein, Aquaporin-like protein [Artemisia annua]